MKTKRIVIAYTIIRVIAILLISSGVIILLFFPNSNDLGQTKIDLIGRGIVLGGIATFSLASSIKSHHTGIINMGWYWLKPTEERKEGPVKFMILQIIGLILIIIIYIISINLIFFAEPTPKILIGK
jgi:hypothetical protein